MKRIILLLIIGIYSSICFSSEKHWRTHFAYNSVQLIALDSEEVYALANGKIFSINQNNEKLTLYNNFSGLHGTEITQLAYDSIREQLLILYSDGKMDVLRNKHMQYIPDLYNKQMTTSKKCNNITIYEDIAYLSMDFGIITFDLNLYEFVDTYYIGDEASEVIVTDVMLYGDSIYAKTANTIYVAHLEDNIVDYRYWNKCTKLPQPFDAKKGKEYVSKNGDIWKVADTQGVARIFQTGEKEFYLPDGPQVNTPYNLTSHNGKLYMVPGGRWAVQNKNPGHVMIYHKGKWTNITNSTINKQTQKPVLDFMDVAVDPTNESHFFVTSYGTGLYEFRNNALHAHYTPSNSILGSAAPANPDGYTRLTGAAFDSQNRLWVTVDGGIDTTLVCFLPDGTQRGLNCNTDPTTRFIFNTSEGLLIDAVQPQRKWLVSCRSIPAVVLLDDGGTTFDASDDKCKVRSEFYDQDGAVLVPEFFYSIAQAPNGDIWIGSSAGPIIIPTTIDFINSNQCQRLRIEMLDGSNLLDTERINAFAWDDEENIWIGTQTGGIYVLNTEATEILAHYTTSNSVMPSNTIVSMAYDAINRQMFIGTGMGLVSYLQDPEALSSTDIPTENEHTYGNMYQWKSHSAFTKVEEIVMMGNKVFGLSSNALFSTDKISKEIEYYNILSGLSGSSIDHIAYNAQLERMLITYQNGQLDIMTKNGTIYNISDLYLKQMNASKQVNDICMYQDKAILGMSFGILVVDMRKAEITDTYYIGNESSEVYINQIAINNDTIYAASNNHLYYANLNNNLVDYSFWEIKPLPPGKTVRSMRAHYDKLYMISNQKDTLIYYLSNNEWKSFTSNYPMRRLCPSGDNLYALPDNKLGIWQINSNHSVPTSFVYGYNYDIVEDNGSYWLGTKDNGLVNYQKAIEKDPIIQEYHPDGPVNNYSYRLRSYGDKVYMLPGGRWANEYKRPGDIMIYQGGWWKNLKNEELVKKANHVVYDIMNVAQDPNDDTHYFLTTYGTGVLEMRDTSFVQLYLPKNSKLFSAAPNAPDTYTRTDGAIFDDQGYLWLLNAGGGEGNVHVISPTGKWHSFDLFDDNRARITLSTPGEILIDKHNPQRKWIPLMRSNTGLILLQDNGTPANHSDDHVTYRKEWKDQYANSIAPENIYTIAQDKKNTLWIGTSSGIFTIPYYIDFATSNECKRITIPRNDGTQLVDFLLDNEQINAIAVDGANRLWVGTATSGVFLLAPVGDISDVTYTVETVAHFTTQNSLMPSNEVLSIAIQETTGEVFIGTGQGLVSYMSDATEPEENFSNIYAYPNPVRPEYQGVITIRGLMDNTEIRIVDASGNLVQIIQGTGGSAVWDGKNTQGQRVASGVYTAICNTKSGKGHGTVKILIIN